MNKEPSLIIAICVGLALYFNYSLPRLIKKMAYNRSFLTMPFLKYSVLILTIVQAAFGAYCSHLFLQNNVKSYIVIDVITFVVLLAIGSYPLLRTHERKL